MIIVYFFKAHLIEYVLMLIFSLLIPLLSPEMFKAADIGTESNKSKFKQYFKRVSFFLGMDFIVLTLLLLLFTLLRNFVGGDTIILILFAICLWAIFSAKRKLK